MLALDIAWLAPAIDYGVIGLLGVLNVVLIAIILERVFFDRSVQLDSFTNPKVLELAISVSDRHDARLS